MTADDVRARFEAWASDGGKCPKAVERTGYDDGYRLMATHLYWLAWQAAHADLAGEVRELVEAARESVAEIERLRDAMFRVYAVAANGGNPTSAIEAMRDEMDKPWSVDRSKAALAKFHPTHQGKP